MKNLAANKPKWRLCYKLLGVEFQPLTPVEMAATHRTGFTFPSPHISSNKGGQVARETMEY